MLRSVVRLSCFCTVLKRQMISTHFLLHDSLRSVGWDLLPRLDLPRAVAHKNGQFPARLGTKNNFHSGISLLADRDTLVLLVWWLFSKTWNPITSPWMKQLLWIRIIHSEDWCLCLVLCTPSGACHKEQEYKQCLRFKMNTDQVYAGTSSLKYLITNWKTSSHLPATHIHPATW